MRYHATFSEASAVCILMEFAEGGDLSALLSARWEAAARASQSHLAEDEVVDWFVQLAEGLAPERVWRAERGVLGSASRRMWGAGSGAAALHFDYT